MFAVEDGQVDAHAAFRDDQRKAEHSRERRQDPDRANYLVIQDSNTYFIQQRNIEKYHNEIR